MANLSDPAKQFSAVTPSDSVDLQYLSSIYVGVSGDVVCINHAGTAVTFTAFPAGSILPVLTTRVNATGTTATNMVAMSQ